MGYHFITDGCRETGNYDIYFVNNGITKKLSEQVRGNNNTGLKDARRIVAKEVIKMGLPDSAVVTHYCHKPGRINNPRHNWTVAKYKVLL